MANTKNWKEVITPVTEYKNGLATPEMLTKVSDLARKMTDIENELYSAIPIEGETTTDNLTPSGYNNGQYGYEDLTQVLPIGARIVSVTLYSSGTANTRNSYLKIYDADRNLVKDVVLGIIGTSNTEFTLSEEIIVQEGYHYCIAYMGMKYIKGYLGTRFPQGNDGSAFYNDYWIGWTFKYVTQGATSSRIDDLEEKVQDIEEQIWIGQEPTIEWVDGFLINSDNRIKAWSGADRVSKPIHFIKGQSVTITTNGDKNYFFKPIAKVPSDFQIVAGATITEALASKTTGNTIETFTYTATDDCYIILCGYNDANLVVAIDNVIVSRFDILQEQIDNIAKRASNPLYGKKLSVNGDSICYGAGYVGGYAKIIGENNNMIVQNIAKSGGTIAGNSYAGTSPRHWICRTMQNIASDADYIIVEGGVNDASSDTHVPLGSITSALNSDIDDTTFYGGLESICRYLNYNCKGKKVGFIIVHQMHDKMKPNGEYYNAIIECLTKYGIPCLDLSKLVPPFGISGFDATMRNEYTHNGDGWHPNELCYRKYYVPKIESWLKTL